VRYSILLATLGRTTELRQFLDSLAMQTWRDFEVLIIDQNCDNRVEAVMAPYLNQFPLKRIASAGGHSRAFNLGLAQVSGDIVAFPDDDCWYDPDLLERVAKTLSRNPSWSGLTGREIAEPGYTAGGRWDRQAGKITPANIFRRAITFSIFLRRTVAQRYAFDETLGVGAGTPWGAGEETDYLLSMVNDGHIISYDPSIGVWHRGRSGPYSPVTYEKARRYGMGMGRVLRKHGFPLFIVGWHVLRPAGGALLSLASGNVSKSRYHWSIFKGRTGGWFLTPQRASPGSQVAALVSRSEDL
jgi:glycosyltransferase involved in cell wall biosynthesis